VKLDRTTVVIEPRPVGACLDLAVLFCRRHVRSMLPITLLFAVAGALLSFALARALGSGLFWAALLFFAASPLLGGVLVLGGGHAVFGDPVAPRAALRAVLRSGSFWLSAFIARFVTALAGLLCFGLPGLPVAVYCGFLPEVLLLEQVDSSDARGRLAELVHGHFGDLLGRALVLVAFAAAAAVALFTLVDQTLLLLFGWPLLLGRLDPRGPAGDLWDLVQGDPAAVAVLAAVVWLLYPVARLAWFFCYLDVRIRKEGWDLELSFRVEARRLSVTA
jgi:hypothetical protein